MAIESLNFVSVRKQSFRYSFVHHNVFILYLLLIQRRYGFLSHAIYFNYYSQYAFTLIDKVWITTNYENDFGFYVNKIIQTMTIQFGVFFSFPVSLITSCFHHENPMNNYFSYFFQTLLGCILPILQCVGCKHIVYKKCRW